MIANGVITYQLHCATAFIKSSFHAVPTGPQYNHATNGRYLRTASAAAAQIHLTFPKYAASY